ncbi:MAG: sugar phosphate isomerase/epimerase [Proteobacteria bacterium]|nr:sugar phosphate isomerase/epimerase [Pseudomonadota bacterium]
MSATPLALGLCSVTFRGLAPAQVIELAAANGVAGIEWGSDKHVPPGDLEAARQVARRCRDLGIRVSSIGSYVEAGATTGQPFASVLDLAEAMGAPTIRVWAGKRGVGSEAASAGDRQAVADALKGMASRAAERGVAVGLEFHPGTLTDTLSSTLDLLSAVDHPNLTTYWQPRPGIGRAEALDEVAALDGKISHFHVFSWTAAKERLPLIAHEAFWLPVLRRALANSLGAPMPRYAMLEFVANDDPAAFRADARTLAGWIASVTER